MLYLKESFKLLGRNQDCAKLCEWVFLSLSILLLPEPTIRQITNGDLQCSQLGGFGVFT